MKKYSENGYREFIKWVTEKYGQPQWTSSEVEFGKQFFELMEDYPSLKKKMVGLGNKIEIFTKIQSYCQEKAKL